MSSCRQAKALFAGRYPATPIACTSTLHIATETQQQSNDCRQDTPTPGKAFYVDDLLTDAESWRGTAPWCVVTSELPRHGQGIR